MQKDHDLILAADIGGTSSRFALFESSTGIATKSQVILPTEKFSSFQELVKSALAALGSVAPGRAVLAVAGPVEKGRFCRPPNIGYVVDLAALAPGLLPGSAVLINDFAAQAHGCRLFGEDRSEVVIPGSMDVTQTQAVVGPGTGLGKSALVPNGQGGYVVCGSEGGHAAFPFNGVEESHFQAFATKALDEPYVRWESIVSGSGLALVYRFLTGTTLTPAQASAVLTPVSPTAELFARFLGRACRDYVLEVLARGGLFISGGVAANNPMLVKHPAFLAEFRLSATHAELLAKIPVRLVTDQLVGLWGAATYAASLPEVTSQKFD